MLKEMEPKPVKAEEDAGSIAQFMETMVSKSESSGNSNSSESNEPKEEKKDKAEVDSGAAFAAQFSQ